MTGAQALWESLVRQGVDVVFGYPGGAILPAYDAMLDFPIRHILVRHEQGATHMADGYARASGRIGACNVHVAPGLGNAMGALYNAKFSGSPIILSHRLVSAFTRAAGDGGRGHARRASSSPPTAIGLARARPPDSAANPRSIPPARFELALRA